MALRDYRWLLDGIVPAWFPGMRPGPEGFASALRLAADRAWEAAEEVTAVIGEHYGAAPAARDGGTA